MPLLEVRNDIVMQHGQELQKRFFHDGLKRCSIVFWENKTDQSIEKFQASLPGHVFEWRPSSGLRYARVDEGEESMKVKQSPVMMMDEKINVRALKEFVHYLEKNPPANRQNLEMITEILRGGLAPDD